jgi:hypothetical protein
LLNIGGVSTNIIKPRLCSSQQVEQPNVQPAPTPIVFPQIADGGGYTTEFIFISADSAASVSVNLVTDNGAALSLGPTL